MIYIQENHPTLDYPLPTIGQGIALQSGTKELAHWVAIPGWTAGTRKLEVLTDLYAWMQKSSVNALQF
jgi:hypothetical protein